MSQPVAWVSDRPLLWRLLILVALILAVLACFHVGPGFAWSWVAFLAAHLL